MQNYRSTDPLTDPRDLAAFEKRQLLEFQRNITELQGVRTCFPYKFGYPWSEEAIELFESGRVVMGRCGNSNACVVCASEKMAKHRRKIEKRLIQWVKSGGSVYWQRLSLQNVSDQPTKKKYTLLTSNWSAMLRLTAFKRAFTAISSPKFFKVLEESLTSCGWYPHYHLVWLIRPGISAKKVKIFLQEVVDLWVMASKKISGALAEVSAQYSDFRKLNVIRGTLTNYTCKHAFHDLGFDPQVEDPYDQKLSPFQVLQVFLETGEWELGVFFADFELASRGLRRVSYSTKFFS